MNLAVPTPLWERIQGLLRADGVESAGIGLANQVVDETGTRLLLSEIRVAETGMYLKRDQRGAQLAPEFVASVVREARDRRKSVVYFHTHPFADTADFSPIDDAGEQVLKDFTSRRVGQIPHAALVVARQEARARLLGTDRQISISIVGSVIHIFGEQTDGDNTEGFVFRQSTFDRQLRAFGHDGQRRIAALNIGIVGLGGTGSIAAEQLAHLGVSRFLLVDPDVLEPSNLNRVVGASIGDVGKLKVGVAADLIGRIRPDAEIETLRESVLRNEVLRRLRRLDAIFCCTDSHGSRYVLNEIAYRFLVPCFDCGVVIAADGARVTHVGGRVQMLAPGLSCLTCGEILDAEQIRRDLLTDFERARDPYILGPSVPQPAVVSLNGVIVSLAITMFLGAFAGLPAAARHQRYNAIQGTVRNIDTRPDDRCLSCSAEGGLAAGDSWPLPGRTD